MNNVLVSEIAKQLKPLGFKKKSNTWHRTNPETIQVINLQKSQWGNQFYINVGILVRALDDNLTPPENKCHVQLRIERFTDAIELKKCLDLEVSSLGDEERREILKTVLDEKVLPYFEAMKTLKQIKARLLNRKIKKLSEMGLVMVTLKNYLGIT